MSWRDFFKSSHTLWLEREIADLKKTHAEDLARANTIADKLRDELQRTRILMTPGLQGVSLPHEHDDDEPPPKTEIVGGTPWQRVQARMIKEDEERWRKAQEAQAALAKGVTNGSTGQDGESPPQRVEGKAV